MKRRNRTCKCTLKLFKIATAFSSSVRRSVKHPFAIAPVETMQCALKKTSSHNFLAFLNKIKRESERRQNTCLRQSTFVHQSVKLCFKFCGFFKNIVYAKILFVLCLFCWSILSFKKLLFKPEHKNLIRRKKVAKTSGEKYFNIAAKYLSLESSKTIETLMTAVPLKKSMPLKMIETLMTSQLLWINGTCWQPVRCNFTWFIDCLSFMKRRKISNQKRFWKGENQLNQFCHYVYQANC